MKTLERNPFTIEQKATLYLDCDGVILDTNKYIRDELLKKYGIDKWTHKRSDVEEDKIVSRFFKELDWYKIINEIPQINDSLHVIECLSASGIFYGPHIFTIYTSEAEKEAKREYFNKYLPHTYVKFLDAKDGPKRINYYPKEYAEYITPCFLVDDDKYNLNSFNGYAIPFDGGKPDYDYPTMKSLEELFDMFKRKDSNGKSFVPVSDDGRYENMDILYNFEIDPTTGYVVTKEMQRRFIKK